MYFTEIQKIMGLLWTLYVNKLNNYKKNESMREQDDPRETIYLNHANTYLESG